MVEQRTKRLHVIQGSASHSQRLNNGDINFELFNGFLYINNNLFIPVHTTIRDTLLEKYHSTVLKGHLGILATTRQITSTFCWQKLKEYVRSFIRECKTCQEIK